MKGRCGDSPGRVVYGATMSDPSGFEFRERANGDVAITHQGRPAAVLRKAAAERFLRDVEAKDPQEVMARATGNYKRGNERGR